MTAPALPVWRTGAIWVVFAALETAAQLTLKMAAGTTASELSTGAWLCALATNPWFQLSIACDMANFFAWMAILRRHDLSLAIPLSSICYFAIIAAGTVFLHESVAVAQWVGLIVIGFGLALISWK